MHSKQNPGNLEKAHNKFGTGEWNEQRINVRKLQGLCLTTFAYAVVEHDIGKGINRMTQGKRYQSSSFIFTAVEFEPNLNLLPTRAWS